MYIGTNYANQVTTASTVTQPDYANYVASTTNSTIPPTQSGYVDSTYNPTNYNQPNPDTGVNSGQANYNYNLAGYNYYQYSTQPTTLSQDTTQQPYPSTYAGSTSNVANQPEIYTQPSTYQPPTYNQGVDSQQTYNQPAYNVSTIYGNTQVGYTQPITQTSYTTASYTQPTSQIYAYASAGSYMQPTTQANYVQPTQTSYVQPATQTDYIQPITQAGFTQPTTQANYTQPTTQAGPAQYDPTIQTPYIQATNQSAETTNKSLDNMLSERMAALMPKSKKEADSNLYVPSQYPQYDYAQGYVQPNNYSYANTIPGSNYHTMSKTSYPYVTVSEQSSVDVNNYSNGANTTAATSDSTYTYNTHSGSYPTSKYK